MNSPSKVRLAVIGVGNMGSAHVREIAGRVSNVQLAAVCDIDQARAERYAADYAVPAFYDYRQLLRDIALDGVVIATPHYDHTPISIAAFEQGLHVLVEKPMAVHIKDGRKMIAAYGKARQYKPDLVFAIMFQQRTYSYWRKIKEMLTRGELGRLVRATWIITDWFRTQSYYDNGGWRATWRGEGGGVLLNQCPHNLDLYQWFFGLPRRVTGLAALGKYHNIEVEDEVTAFFEHANGMVGHLITSTAESPGTNRLEIVGELGKLVFESGKMTFQRNQSSMLEFICQSLDAFDKTPCQEQVIEFPAQVDWGHATVLAAFGNAILRGEPVIVQATEGLNSLMLGNAIIHSHFLGQPVELPIDEDAYETRLLELAATSRYQKVVREADLDVSKSFGVYKK